MLLEKSVEHEEGSLSWLVSNLVKVCISLKEWRGWMISLLQSFLELGKGNVLQVACRPDPYYQPRKVSFQCQWRWMAYGGWDAWGRLLLLLSLSLITNRIHALFGVWCNASMFCGHWRRRRPDRSALTMPSLVIPNCTRPAKPISVSRTSSLSAPCVPFLGKSLKFIVVHPLWPSNGGTYSSSNSGVCIGRPNWYTFQF